MAFRDPLVPVFVALALGVAASQAAPDGLSLRQTIASAAVLVILAPVARRWITRRAAWVAGLAGLICLGGALETWHRPPPPPRIEFSPGETLEIAGCVVEPVAASPDREQAVVELAEHARVRVNWYLEEGQSAPGLRYGQQVEMEVKLRQPRNYGNPGAFDFEHYLARRDIYWTATANAKSAWKVTGTGCGRWPLTWIYAAREAAISRLDTLYAGDRYSRGMTRALLIGDTAMLERSWAEDFRRTGTYHALVISGLHLTLLTGWFLFFLRVVSAGVGWSLFSTSLVAWFYTAMAGGSAPIARAAAGLTLYLAGRCLFRQPRVLNLLAAVAIGYLVVDPGSLSDASFQLSFLSVAMIGGVAAPLLERTLDPYARGMRRLGNEPWDLHLEPKVASVRVEMRLLAETAWFALRVPRRVTLFLLDWAARGFFYFASLLVVSAVVQAGLMLPMIAYFHRLSVSGLTANLVIVPLMNGVVLTGFAAVATGSPMLAGWAAMLLDWARRVAAWHAQFEPPVRLADPPGWLVVGFVASLLVAIGYRIVRVGRRVPVPLADARGSVGECGGLEARGVRQQNRDREGVGVQLLTAVPFLVCLALLILQPWEPTYEKGNLEVTTLDVGQGDGLLLASPHGRFMLVDAGGFPMFGKRPTRPPIDIGEEVVSPYLFSRGIREVDVVVATHAHEDHIGGLRAVIENFRPRELWTGAFPESELTQWIRARGVKIIQRRAGERVEWDGVRFHVLSPPVDYEPGPTPKNNDSLVLHVSLGARSILLTGDIERQLEGNLTEPADILKVAHHGSRTSTTDYFLDAVHPRWAVVSVGFANQFRHPHPQVMERLAERGIAVWRTDESGQVRMLTNGKSWRIEPFRFINKDPRIQSAAPAEPRKQALQRLADPGAIAR